MSQSYHHGQLRVALIEAGLALLDRHGPAGVSLRAVARESGVSQTAPYAHFGSKRELMSAIAAAGFEKLTRSLDRSPDSRLSVLGMRYVEFALANPGLYNLMFGPNEHIDPDNADLATASQRCFASLRSVVRKEGFDDAANRDAIAAWSLVHGYSMLLINEKLHSLNQEILLSVLNRFASTTDAA